MKFEQMEFDFDPPKKRPADTPVPLKVELTRGWDGEMVRELNIHGTKADASNVVKSFVHENLDEYGPYRDVWTWTMRKEPVKHIICDYGSYTYFGRITYCGR